MSPKGLRDCRHVAAPGREILPTHLGSEGLEIFFKQPKKWRDRVAPVRIAHPERGQGTASVWQPWGEKFSRLPWKRRSRDLRYIAQGATGQDHAGEDTTPPKGLRDHQHIASLGREIPPPTSEAKVLKPSLNCIKSYRLPSPW